MLKTKITYSGLTMRFLDSELSQEWISEEIKKEYFKNCYFKLIFKDGKKTKLIKIIDYKQNDSYIVFGEIFKSPLITLDKNITYKGIKISAINLNKLDGLELYFDKLI